MERNRGIGDNQVIKAEFILNSKSAIQPGNKYAEFMSISSWVSYIFYIGTKYHSY